jgi:Zn-dependent peptidase ImmA (M78 family)
MDEQDVVRLARAFMEGLDLTKIGDSLDPYLEKANARVREEDLGEGQSGTVAQVKGKTVITVNAGEPLERQRFTICHELAHKVLGLPSNHAHVPQWGYAKRDINEILCDIFAAELLMPHAHFLALSGSLEPSQNSLMRLAGAFTTSYPATASRFARLAKFPCAFVTMESGWVRYAALSTPLRAMGACIPAKSPIPTDSVAGQLRHDGSTEFRQEIVSQDVWFDNWPKGLDLSELSRHHPSSDTTLALLWFEEEDAPCIEVDRFGRRVEEHEGLQELTGELPWPGKGKRK